MFDGDVGEKIRRKSWIEFLDSVVKQRKKQGGRPHMHRRARLEKNETTVDRPVDRLET